MKPISIAALLSPTFLLAACTIPEVPQTAHLEPKPRIEEPRPDHQPTRCAPTPEEALVAEKMRTHSGQEREKMICDGRLETFARDRAWDFVEREYFGHVTPDGVGPNALLRERGFDLPSYYVRGRTNFIESIAGGINDPADVVPILVDSADHRPHMLGIGEMRRRQTLYGIGHAYAPGTPHRHYWVVVTARHPEPDEPRVICTPPPLDCFRVR
jgi:hypothetical protein